MEEKLRSVEGVMGKESLAPVPLPQPRKGGPLTLEEALARRRSVRAFAPDVLTLDEVGQLLWAAQGLVAPEGRRTTPSAGALYPLEVYLAAGVVAGLPPGVYRYRPVGHRLEPVQVGDVREALCRAALAQDWVRAAPAVVALTAVFERTTWKYGRRGVQYVHMEVGHAAQNLYLQATALGLGTVFVGAFRDDEVQRALGVGPEEVPLGLMPLGRPAA